MSEPTSTTRRELKLPDSGAWGMSCLTGIAIPSSIDQKKPIRIADLV